jgi:hypothetical protein
MLNLTQTNLRGQTSHHHTGDEWGHHMLETRDESTYRIIYQNIGPQRSLASALHAKLTAKAIRNSQADIFLFGEHGLNAGKLAPENSWDARIRPLFSASFSCVAHNEKEGRIVKSELLVGGTGISVLNAAVDRKMSHRKDPSGLGQWAWIALRG